MSKILWYSLGHKRGLTAGIERGVRRGYRQGIQQGTETTVQRLNKERMTEEKTLTKYTELSSKYPYSLTVTPSDKRRESIEIPYLSELGMKEIFKTKGFTSTRSKKTEEPLKLFIKGPKPEEKKPSISVQSLLPTLEIEFKKSSANVATLFTVPQEKKRPFYELTFRKSIL